MPFKSKAQARAAFGGYLGSEMKEKAEEFAHETPGGIKSLPERKKRESVPGQMATRHKLSQDRVDSMRHIKKGK